MAFIYEYQGMRPNIAADVFIAENATIIGNVTIESGSSVWYGAVLRGDTGRIHVGAGTSVQDNVVLHVNEHHDTVIGTNVTIGHGAVLEGCVVGDGTLIGMNATVLSGSTVGNGSLIGAGAVVREGGTVPDGMIAVGIPAKVRGPVSDALARRLVVAAEHYQHHAQTFKLIKRIE